MSANAQPMIRLDGATKVFAPKRQRRTQLPTSALRLEKENTFRLQGRQAAANRRCSPFSGYFNHRQTATTC
jgi:hypothetical protein